MKGSFDQHTVCMHSNIAFECYEYMQFMHANKTYKNVYKAMTSQPGRPQIDNLRQEEAGGNEDQPMGGWNFESRCKLIS